MNLIEYVKKFGDRTFGELPFSEVDSLVLSTLSYLDFFGLVREQGFTLRLRELKGEGERLCLDSIHPRDEFLLWNAVCESKRFSALKAGYYREIDDDNLPERFAAVSFLFESGIIYAAFRGTDNSIAAWHEDFDLLFQNVIPSQEEAVKYLLEVMAAEGSYFLVGGHSKGGNLAVYAASLVEEAFQARILAIYDHDGPGFCENFFNTSGYVRIKDLVQKTVPHDSLVGMLLCHTERYRVVKSRKTLFGQHNPFEWEIDKFASFHILPKTASISRKAEVVLKDWIAQMSLKERKKFVTALFQVISASGAEKVSELSKHRLRAYSKMRRAYRALPPEERALVKKGGGILLRIWLRLVRKQSKKKRMNF